MSENSPVIPKSTAEIADNNTCMRADSDAGDDLCIKNRNLPQCDDCKGQQFADFPIKVRSTQGKGKFPKLIYFNEFKNEVKSCTKGDLSSRYFYPNEQEMTSEAKFYASVFDLKTLPRLNCQFSTRNFRIATNQPKLQKNLNVDESHQALQNKLFQQQLKIKKAKERQEFIMNKYSKNRKERKTSRCLFRQRVTHDTHEGDLYPYIKN